MAIVVAEKIIEMVFIMLCGIVLYKTGLIDYKAVKHSSYAGFTSYDIPILPDRL